MSAANDFFNIHIKVFNSNGSWNMGGSLVKNWLNYSA
jgi:hypothetical protein